MTEKKKSETNLKLRVEFGLEQLSLIGEIGEFLLEIFAFLLVLNLLILNEQLALIQLDLQHLNGVLKFLRLDDILHQLIRRGTMGARRRGQSIEVTCHTIESCACSRRRILY